MSFKVWLYLFHPEDFLSVYSFLCLWLFDPLKISSFQFCNLYVIYFGTLVTSSMMGLPPLAVLEDSQRNRSRAGLSLEDAILSTFNWLGAVFSVQRWHPHSLPPPSSLSSPSSPERAEDEGAYAGLFPSMAPLYPFPGPDRLCYICNQCTSLITSASHCIHNDHNAQQ